MPCVHKHITIVGTVLNVCSIYCGLLGGVQILNHKVFETYKHHMRGQLCIKLEVIMVHLVLDMACVDPIFIYARHQGNYCVPVLAYAIDFRFEDIPNCSTAAQRLRTSWIAKNPAEGGLWIIVASGDLIDTKATQVRLEELIKQNILPADVYQLPDDWYEYILALDDKFELIKAPKVAHPGDPTPEDIDEILYAAVG